MQCVKETKILGVRFNGIFQIKMIRRLFFRPKVEAEVLPVVEVASRFNSRDDTPWSHPYLSANNIGEFRCYSDKIWDFALSRYKEPDVPLNIAFLVNMAQNMNKWARLAQRFGAIASLYCHPMDESAINSPEWDDFDGEYKDIFDGDGFLNSHGGGTPLEVPTFTVPMGDQGLLQAWENSRLCGDWIPLHQALGKTSIFPEAAFAYQGIYPYLDWARALEKYDVMYACSVPIAAYLSGRPYCFSSTGGDLQFDCGLSTEFGMVMRLAVNRAKFILVSNPHTLGHCRRLGFQNAVYLPYPMDSSRYSPGSGHSRSEWEEKFGPGVYVLTTSRIDRGVKGHDESFLDALFAVTRERSNVRFVFLGWGNDMNAFRERVTMEGLQNQIIILPPVGKTRLIDYYRSCDVVLDQFVYGYYGATALEAASVGKPVVMKLRLDQYEPLYKGDVAPVENAGTPSEMREALLKLVDDGDYRQQKGRAMRSWLVRNHGEEKTTPLMLALLRLAAEKVSIPKDIENPLCTPLSDEEIAYHRACLRPAV